MAVPLVANDAILVAWGRRNETCGPGVRAGISGERDPDGDLYAFR
jgi:hypothetical protein